MTGPWNAAVHTTKMFLTEKKYLFFNPHFWLSFKVDLSAPLLLSRNREPDTRLGPATSQQPRARLRKVSTNIRGKFHNILRPPEIVSGTLVCKDLHLKKFADKTPVGILMGFVDKRPDFRLRDNFNTTSVLIDY